MYVNEYCAKDKHDSDEYKKFAKQFYKPKAQYLKLYKCMADKDKDCAICWDAININTNLFYNYSRDKIIRYVNNGYQHDYITAQKILIIMVRDLLSNWIQPIAFFYKSSCYNAFQVLKDCSC